MGVNLFHFGGPQYGLEDAKIARNNLDGTFGTNYDVPSVQMLSVQIQTTNAQLEGDDQITAATSKPISAQVSFRFGSISAFVLSLIVGQAVQSSQSTGIDTYMFFDIEAGAPIPYWGIIGRADAVEGSGDTHFFVPKVKMMEGFTAKLEYNTFSIPEITCQALGDHNFPGVSGKPTIMRPIFHSAAKACTLPPTYI